MTEHVVTFDAGQVLIELDLAFLAVRLGERGIVVEVDALERALPAAWAVHDRDVAAGIGHPWRQLMTALVIGAGGGGIDAGRATDAAEWLWTQQRAHNLFRKPVAGMVALARELAARGVRIAVLSNSEGRLAELLAQIGIADAFAAIIDSGRVGIAKPDPRIFALALDAVGGGGDGGEGIVPIHIGDSWAADVVGARGAGWRAIWYGPRVTPTGDPAIASARDPSEARAALVAWGLLA